MKKIADFIVEKRILILILVLAIAGGCFFLMKKVEVNSDMTKYLPDASSMKKGMDLMEKEFPEVEEEYTIRVMFKGMSEEEKLEMKEKLSGIEYVTKVDYKPGDEDYNKDDYVKFVLHTDYDYHSDEEASIEEKLAADFTQNEMIYMNDSGDSPELPLWAILTAVGLLTLILIIMCNSWVEPFLFLFTIGVAILINLGTNIFMGTIAETTFSVTAILQLVLSMDYSVILANRFLQEKDKTDDKKEAMKSAITGAFSSISSSSFTTMVGLFALVFMSFKIGPDLGIVLAKGVFFSVVCVFLILPGLLLMFTKVLDKTRKPAPHIPVGGLARFSNRFRVPLTVFFVLLFVGVYFLQKQTDVSYSMVKYDAISDVFPKENQVVLVYANEDDEKVTALADDMKNWDDVKSASNYSNTLAKQYTSAEMVDAIEDLSDSMGDGKKNDITPTESTFNMLYFKYYDGKPGKMTVSEFMRFLTEDVMTDPSFASYMGDAASENLDMMKKLSDAELLKTPIGPTEMAGLFGMEPAQCEQLYLYYFLQAPDLETSKVKINDFVGFIADDLVKDPVYSTYFGEEMSGQIEQLRIFTDPDFLQQECTAEILTGVLGAEPEQVSRLLQAVSAASPDVKPTFYGVFSFLVDNRAKLAGMLGREEIGKMAMLKPIMDTAIGGVELDETAISQIMGSDAASTHQMLMIYMLKHDDPKLKMSAETFVQFLTSGVMDNPNLSSGMDEESRKKLANLVQLITTVTSGKELTHQEMYTLFSGMTADFKAETVELLYIYHDANMPTDQVRTMSIEQMMNYMNDTLIYDDAFKTILDEKMVSDIKKFAVDLNDGIRQLKGPEYSRMIMVVTVPEEGEVTNVFYKKMEDRCEEFAGNYYLVGSSAMNYEMSRTFSRELLLITLLSAGAIFLVVLITFGSLAVPVILVVLVQTGVFITISAVGFQGYSINYLALLIVQCILMGSMIDYGILYSNYYREARKTCGRAEALKKAYAGAIHTILTSGLIIVTVTAILGQCFGEPTIEQIIQTISIGAGSAIILVLFVLPGVLACFDRFTAGKHRLREGEETTEKQGLAAGEETTEKQGQE